MNLYTFDKEELLKLQQDVLANPEKYEKILTQKTTTFQQHDRYNRKWSDVEVKREEYEYWYRVWNQGRMPTDALPYYQELLQYKDFVDNVEERALGTLRWTIGRLLLDFENQKGINEVREFEQGKETKTDAYKRLLKLVNDKDNEVKEVE